MGDMGDIFRDMREMKRGLKRERAEGQRSFIESLRARATYMSILPGGFRFVFKSLLGAETFDYWPSSGKWCELKVRRYRQGEPGLLRRLDELGVEHERTEDDAAGLRRFLGVAAA